MGRRSRKRTRRRRNGKPPPEAERGSFLARARPGLAALMTIFMISLAGIPGTAGFIAKFALFSAAVDAGQVPLTILAVLMSVVSVYYYLRVPVLMYMREPQGEEPRMEISSGEAVVLCTCAFVVLYLGFFPNDAELPALDWARESVRLFFVS